MALGEVLGEEEAEDEDEGGGEPVRRVGARPAMVLAAPSTEALAVVGPPWEGTSSLFPIPLSLA